MGRSFMVDVSDYVICEGVERLYEESILIRNKHC